MKFLDKMFSLILGLSIGIILEYYINPKIVYHGPNSNIIKKKFFKYNNKTYKLITEAYSCGIKPAR
jgi:hypothetical protein